MYTSDANAKTVVPQATGTAAALTLTCEVQRDANGMPIAVSGDSHTLLERTRLVLCIALLTFFFLNPFALFFDTLRGIGLGASAGAAATAFERASLAGAGNDYARAHDGSRLLLSHDDLQGILYESLEIQLAFQNFHESLKYVQLAFHNFHTCSRGLEFSSKNILD